MEEMKRDEKSLSLSFKCKFIDQSLHRSLKKECQEEMNGRGKRCSSEKVPLEFPYKERTQEEIHYVTLGGRPFLP